MEAILDEDLNGHFDYGKYLWSHQDPSEKVFRAMAKRLKKVSKLKRPRRHTEAEHAAKFFAETVANPEWTTKLDECMDQILDTVAVISENLFQLLEEGDEMHEIASGFSASVCTLLSHLSESLDADNFVKKTSKLYICYLELAINNPNSWMHSLIFAGPMELISLECFAVKDANLVVDTFKSQMLKIHKSITSCGDFECQRTSLVALLSWLKYITPELKSAFLKESFTLLPRQFRKMLLRDFTLYDADYKTRVFLNALNREFRKTHRPYSVYSIVCSNVFVEGVRVKPPQHLDIRDFWVDFSCKSKRIHFYSSCSNSNEDEWRSNSFRKDQVDSICMFYPASESQSTDFVFNTQHSSQMSHRPVNTVSYVHILLKDETDSFSQFSETNAREKKSLVFEFTNVKKVEEALEYFAFDMHECDVETCNRLVPQTGQAQHDTTERRNSPQIENIESARCQNAQSVIETPKSNQSNQVSRRGSSICSTPTQFSPEPVQPEALKKNFGKVEIVERVFSPLSPESDISLHFKDVPNTQLDMFEDVDPEILNSSSVILETERNTTRETFTAAADFVPPASGKSDAQLQVQRTSTILLSPTPERTPPRRKVGKRYAENKGFADNQHDKKDPSSITKPKPNLKQSSPPSSRRKSFTSEVSSGHTPVKQLESKTKKSKWDQIELISSPESESDAGLLNRKPKPKSPVLQSIGNRENIKLGPLLHAPSAYSKTITPRKDTNARDYSPHVPRPRPSPSLSSMSSVQSSAKKNGSKQPSWNFPWIGMSPEPKPGYSLPKLPRERVRPPKKRKGTENVENEPPEAAAVQKKENSDLKVKKTKKDVSKKPAITVAVPKASANAKPLRSILKAKPTTTTTTVENQDQIKPPGPRVPCWRKMATSSPELKPSDPYDLEAAYKNETDAEPKKKPKKPRKRKR